MNLYITIIKLNFRGDEGGNKTTTKPKPQPQIQTDLLPGFNKAQMNMASSSAWFMQLSSATAVNWLELPQVADCKYSQAKKDPKKTYLHSYEFPTQTLLNHLERPPILSL